MPTSDRPTVVVMAKAPEPGAVKTRLGPQLSADAASELYGCMLLDTLDLVRQVPAARVLAFAPAEARARFAALCPDFALLRQEGADLGSRMAGVFAALFARRAGPVVLLGADAPTLPVHVVTQAITTLAAGAADLVLVPVVDGGYCLIGLTAARPALFADMPWSTTEVLARTLDRASALALRVALLREWWDIDTPDDLRRFESPGPDEGPARRTRAFLAARAMGAAAVRDAGRRTMTIGPRARVTAGRRLWAVAGGVAVALSLAVVAQLGDVRGWLAGSVQAIGGQGAVGLALFVGLYAAVTVLLLPAAVLTLGGGAIFGVARGGVAVWVGAMLGATMAFLIGRYLARNWVERRLAGHAGLRAIDDAVEREGWKIVVLTRLSPALPFVLLNYAFGLTRVSLGGYVAASAVGMVPGIAMYAYLGSAAGSVAAAVAGSASRTPMEWALLGIGLLATVTVTTYVTRLARAALSRRPGAG
jgi:rSAM/selenodomain-associated transferase 1